MPTLLLLIYQQLSSRPSSITKIKTGQGFLLTHNCTVSSTCKALSKWKALNTPRKIERDPLNIPSGV